MTMLPRRIILTALLAMFVASSRDLAAQQASLPLVLPDNHGIRWDVQPDGSIGDGGNDLYDGGGRLYLAGRTFHYNGQAAFDPVRNELTLGPTEYRLLKISRRIHVNRQLGFCRWAEVLQNTSSARVNMQLRIHFDLGGIIQNTQPFMDDKGRTTLALAFGDQRHNYAMIAGGRGGKLIPLIQPRQGSDQLQLIYDVEVPPHQTIVIVHIQGYRRSLSDAAEFISTTRENVLLGQLPRELIKHVVNFRPAGEKSIEGNHELLRGQTSDLVELRSRGGELEPDLLRGALRDEQFTLQTFYGRFEFPASDVVCILNPRSPLPRQLLVTKFGEAFFGRLAEESIAMELADGKRLAIPLEAFSRVGARPRPGEPEQWKLDHPMAVLRAGDRMDIFIPPGPLNVSTRYGLLPLRPEHVSSLTFRGDEGAAHQIVLTDGSRVSGLVEAPAFDLKLARMPLQPSVHLPVSSLSRLQFFPPPSGPDDAHSILRTTSGDLLCGALEGRVYLDTAYDSIDVDCGEIKRLAAVPDSLADVELTLWDDTLIRGQLREGAVSCRLRSGMSVMVPAAMIGEYSQPRPSPSPRVIESIHELVRELDSDNWRRRNSAQSRLLALGPVTITILKELYPGQSPEAQQRIELILPPLEAQGRRPQERAPTTATPPPGPARPRP